MAAMSIYCKYCIILCLTLLLACIGCNQDKQRASLNREMFFEKRWQGWRQDHRYSALTIHEFIYYTQCEAFFLGNKNIRNANIIIIPNDADNWTINGSNNTTNRVIIKIVYNKVEDTVVLEFSSH